MQMVQNIELNHLIDYDFEEAKSKKVAFISELRGCMI